ncbi:MAG: hypothetical protein ACFB15_32430 [Cyclobacteriaceae bacterium]
MSIIDGEIADSEYQLCVAMACRLGFGKDEVEETIGEIKMIWDRN